MALSFYCRSSIEGIVHFFDLVIGYHVSKGKIHDIREKARLKAEEFDSRIDLTPIHQIATDEIFQQDTPVLTGVDLKTRYIFLMEPAKDRTGKTWQSALEEEMNKGLHPKLCVSDGGSGMLKGIPETFPEIDLQLDVFHSLRDLGIEIHKKERKAISKLSELYLLEQRVNGKRPQKKTIESYNKARENIHECLTKADTLDILSGWLKEYVGYTGYGYEKSLDICRWILDEMEKIYPHDKKYMAAIATFRKRLPTILLFLRRLQADMDKAATAFHADGHAFMLMYNQSAYPSHSVQYNAIENKLYHIFRERLPEARLHLSKILQDSFRASSLIENVNNCLRAFIDLKREIPEKSFILLKVFFNTRKTFRSRKTEWDGSNALERLTGIKHPEFLDIVSAPLDYTS